MKYLISWIIRHVPRKYLQKISHYVLKIVALFYRGKAVECPVCQQHFSKFIPYGRGASARNNALCPSCLSLERHRLMYLFLKEKTPFFQEKLKVLHIAPEHCFIHLFEKMPHLEYITADIESPLAKIKMDIHQIPFEANTFEVAFCNHVLEHVQDDIKAMSEIYRVLKPNGWAIVQVPFFDMQLQTTYENPALTSPQERYKAFGQEDHVRMYGKDYSQRLAQVGFKVTEDDFVKQIPTTWVEKYALPKDEIIYFCKK